MIAPNRRRPRAAPIGASNRWAIGASPAKSCRKVAPSPGHPRLVLNPIKRSLFSTGFRDEPQPHRIWRMEKAWLGIPLTGSSAVSPADGAIAGYPSAGINRLELPKLSFFGTHLSPNFLPLSTASGRRLASTSRFSG